jgi:HAD superfamily hydrolase (TIGR01509 family)
MVWPAMFRALLWDHDGVLVDTEGLYCRSVQEVLASVGVELSPAQYRQLFLIEGKGAFHLARERGVSEAQIEALRRERGRRYLELLRSEPVLLPGVPHIVQRLSRHHRMAIVTSSEREPFELIHRGTDLLQHFELILTRDAYVHSKPHPEPYLTALVRLGLPAEACLVIEDSQRGLRAAKAAGLTCWVVPSALTQDSDFSAADCVFDSLSQLADALEARVPARER